jgi:hypothetical protein
MNNGDSYRAYYAVVMDKDSMQYYELGYRYNPTVEEVLSDFQSEVRERFRDNSLVLEAAQLMVHTSGQENFMFNEQEAFEFSSSEGTWLRIVCPSRMELNQLVSGN